MLTLTAGSLLAGALFGLHSRVIFCLVPTIGTTLLLVLAAGLAHGNDLGSTLLAMGAAGLALQFGYLVGAVTRFGFDQRGRSKNSPALRLTQS